MLFRSDEWNGVEETLNGVVLRHMQQYGSAMGGGHVFGEDVAGDQMSWDDLMHLPQ